MNAEPKRRAGVARDGGSGSKTRTSNETICTSEISEDAILDRLAAHAEIIEAAAPRLVGVAMRIAEASEQPVEGAEPFFEIALVDEAGAIACVLGRYHEEEIVAHWRRLGLASGLPLMLQNPDGSLFAPYPQIGPLALGPVRIRRRHGLLSGRRPRFLTRRKTGRPTPRPLVYREREIVGGAS